MSPTNSSQQETLQKFRSSLIEQDLLHEGDTIGTDDETLLRFLRARKFDLNASVLMFKKCQQWRKTAEGVGIDELYKQIDPFDYPEREAVFDCWPMWFHKTDKKGRPLNIHFYGKFDLRKLYKQCTPERHWQSFLVNAECLPREILPGCSRQAGKPIGTVFVIIDLKDFGLSQFWEMKGLARGAFQVSQDYYPETMGQVAIINAPSSFSFIWKIMKPWMAKETQEKVDVLGSDYKQVLLNLVDEENLPSVLGGKCTCGGTNGESRCDMSGAGPWMEGRVGWGPKAKAQQEMVNGSEKISASSSEDGN